MKKAKGIKQRKMWAVFDDKGRIWFKTINKHKRESKETITLRGYAIRDWSYYTAEGFTVQKILVDIKIITKNNGRQPTP